MLKTETDWEPRSTRMVPLVTHAPTEQDLLTNRESTTSKAQELGLVIQGTTINRDLEHRATLQGPFTRYDTNHINFGAGNFGPASSVQ